MKISCISVPGAMEAVERLTKQVRKVYLENVLQSIHIEASYVKEKAGFWKQQYKVKFDFITRKSLKTFTHVKPRHILRFMETTFLSVSYIMCVTMSQQTRKSALPVTLKICKRHH